MKREQRKLLTRQNLIDAALTIGAEKGFAQISIREITAICDLTPPAFYRHFESLDALGIQLLDEISKNLRHLLHEVWSGMSAGDQSVKDSLNVFFTFVLDHEKHFRLFLGQRYGSSTMFKSAIRKELRQFVTTLANDLQRKKIFHKRAEMVAEIIVSLVFGRGLEVLDTPIAKREILKDRLHQQIMFVLKAD
jgi:AcrR family transcriptional regulator